MQLVKQLILKNYQKYVENKLNNRFFPFELGQSISLAMVVMSKEHGYEINNEQINKINKLYKLYLKMPISSCEFIDDPETKIKKYHQVRSNIKIELEKELEKASQIIFDFIKEYQDTKVETEQQLELDGDGVFAIIHPFYTYDVNERRKRWEK